MKQTLLYFLLFLTTALSAQSVLRGKVTDQDGLPLEGVTVQERGTANGTTTAPDGSYALTYKNADAIIVFSFVGFATQEVRTGGRTMVDIAMVSDEKLLDQVIVVGTRRSDRTQIETPVPVDIINVDQVSPTSARYDLTAMLNYAAPSFNYNKQSGSDGADHIDLATLRGLGPDQTLVLVNGKRRHQTAFVAVFGTRGRGNSGTDLNAIPALAIDRIEILRDGASAQYGSDAIAGVINIILKKTYHKFTADIGVSSYYDRKYNPAFRKTEFDENYIFEKKLDGVTYNVAANYGLPIGSRGGFFNFTLDYVNAGKTYRQDLDRVLPTNTVRRAHGDGSLEGYGGMYNMEIPFATGNRLSLYSFGGYNRKESDAYAFTRNLSARPERFPDNGQGIPIFVEGIMHAASDSDIYYNPHIQTHIQDASFALGVKGSFGEGWNWDLSNVTGYNQFWFFGDKTFNAGLGANQTHFDDGGFSFLQNTSNLNFSRLYPTMLEGFNLAFGAEYRFENYQLFAGEEASYANYDDEKASGAQGFPGYQPGDEADAKRSCVGAYGDVELDITKRFLVGAAMRLEHYSDFGFTPNFKLSSRYKIADNFNLRGSVSTGFRAPSLQQINFSSTFTTVQGGNIAEVKIAPNSSPITRAAGIPELKEETAFNASVGFSWKPIKELIITADAYQVQIKDRVVLSGQFSAGDTSLNPDFTGTLNALNVSLAQFFANAVNTINRGVDLVIDYNRRVENRHFRMLLTGNFQKMEIDQINVPERLNDTQDHRDNFLSDREQKFILASAPPVKFAGTFEYGLGPFTLGLRLNYFGKQEILGYGQDGLGIHPTVPLDDGSGDVPDRYEYGGKFVPDIYGSIKLGTHLTVNLGVDNFLNVHPDLGYVPGAEGWAYNNETGGPWDAVQMGGNGLRAFLRLGLSF